MRTFPLFACKLRAYWVPALALAVALAGALATTSPGRAQTPAQLEHLRRQAVRALFIDSPLPPLAATNFGSEAAAPGVHIEHVTFATQFGRRVPAIVYAPDHPHGRVPALVVVCGHGGDKSSWYAVYTGLLYASAGSVVVTYDPIGEFERSTTRASETEEHDRPIPGLAHPERVGGLMIEDALQAVRYAASRPDVDPSRIALLGYSMGSFHAVIASALAGPQLPRIRALVLSGGGTLDGPNQYWDSGAKINCQAGPYKALDFLGDRAAVLYALRARSGPTLVLNGTVDSLVTRFNEQEPFFVALRARIAQITGSRANLPQTIWFPGAGHRPSWVTQPAAIWLQEQLHFPHWTETEIERFPTVRAADWVAQTHVRISHGYQVEQKEGGVRAIDLHLPGLTRQQLTAVPAAEWAQHTSLYTLSGWIPLALAAGRTPASTASAPVQSQHP